MSFERNAQGFNPSVPHCSHMCQVVPSEKLQNTNSALTATKERKIGKMQTF